MATTETTAGEDFAAVYRALLDRTPESRPEPDLDRMRRVVDLLGHPEHAYRTVHVAGTNGKTSTARLIEHYLTAVGLRTGRFTSPHLTSPAERIAVDGAPIDQADFVQAYEDVIPFVEAVDAESVAEGGPRMTFFEVMTTMAFQAFASAPVDVAVVETGMGGLWDATSVIAPDVTVLTPIDYDHMEYLGDSIEDIAHEKAGVLRREIPAVLAAQPHPEALDILVEQAETLAVPVYLQGRSFDTVTRVPGVGGQQLDVQGLAARYDDLFLSLLGPHQAQNASVAIAALESLLGGGEQALPGDLLERAFGSVTSPGRAEVVRQAPTVLVDAAHNPHGIRAVAETVREAFRFTKVVGLVGVLADKEVDTILDELEPLCDEVVITRSSSSRALPADVLADHARDVFGEDRVHEAEQLADGIQLAVDRAETLDPSFAGIVATGSVTLAAEVRALFGQTEVDGK